jgi:alkyl sulfatase BDS1-like metallo-beta-lactamase superfamily hydrolase
MVLAMPIDVLFDLAAVHVIGERATTADVRIDFAFTDLGETWAICVRRGVLNARKGASADAPLTVSGPKAVLVGVVLRPGAAGPLLEAGRIKVEGDASMLDLLGEVLDTFEPNFAVVTP